MTLALDLGLAAASPRAARWREPGLVRFEPGTERYRLPGGGGLILHLFPGDEIILIDREGGQVCEIAAFRRDADGAWRDGLAVLGLRAEAGAAPGIAGLLAGEGENGAEIARQLRHRGIPLAAFGTARLGDAGSRPGEIARLVAETDLDLVLHAPGGDIAPDAQNPATDCSLILRRAKPPAPGATPLPAPLGEVIAEYRIDRRTAGAYEVREGQFIQIIDVDGRQCSDFLAFDAERLQRGIERGLDLTTTRTLLGRLYPGPGLAAKFFDADMQPLCEVVRDTCGRHDTFGLACTSRFYEDAGYPGHPSCSENFNSALAPFGLARRPGWPAVNLFYNTGIAAQNAIFLDDPWSRPGDYVLLRASRDLVCGSSACPDDIDATNAWNPTDIHVRIYDSRQSFSKAVAYRMKPDSEPRLTQESGFHPRTSRLTRNFAEYRGFWLPNRFQDGGPIGEYWAAREAVIVMDLSALRKFEILGADAETLLQTALTRNIRRLGDGEVVYSALCYPHGGMIDDGTLFRLGPDRYRWIGGEEYGGEWLRQVATERGLDQVRVKSATDQLHNIAVQGPKSRELMKAILWTPPARAKLEELRWFQFTIGRIGDYNGLPVVVSRTGYSGELGYEIFCHPKDAPALWDAVWEAGQPLGLKPIGLEALDMLRIEAGLIFAGAEFDDSTDPFEAGIGFTVALQKGEDFIGRAALERRKANPQRRLVGLEIESQEPIGHGAPLHVGRARIGVVTSACRSPLLGKSIALGRIDIAHAELGAEIEIGRIDGQQKRLAARIIRFPFYDPEKTKPRS